MNQIVILISLSLLLADSAVAGFFRVKLLSESGEKDRPIEVVATSTDTSNANTISAVTAVPGEAQLLLEEKGTTWRISVVDEDYWSESPVVFVSENDQSLSLRVYPVGMLTGKISLSTSEELPDEFRIRFESSPGKGEVSRTTVHPRVSEEGAWIAKLPKGLMDLRLGADGCVGEYRWDQEVSPDKPLDLGIIMFREGSSVTGWATLDERPLEDNPIAVRLVPHVLDDSVFVLSPQQVKRLETVTMKTETNRRGFFQFDSVEPGDYIAIAEHPGFSPSEKGIVRVEQGLEAHIPEPFRLSRPIDFQLYLTPPVDPYGNAWSVALSAHGETRKPGISGKAEESGFWEALGLSRGESSLSISSGLEDGQSDSYYDEIITLDSQPMHLEMSVIQVDGEIRIGAEPATGRFSLAGVDEKEIERSEIFFEADEDGRFAGYLPEEGTYLVKSHSGGSEIEFADPIEVRADPGSRNAYIEITLPDGRIEGRVISEDGEPAPRALVDLTYVYRPGYGRSDADKSKWSLRTSQIWADKKGHFVIFGLSEGSYSLIAKTGLAQSDLLDFSLDRGEAMEDIEIIVHDTKEVVGTIVGTDGRPLSGAAIITRPNRPMKETVFTSQQAVTNAHGQFSLRAGHSDRQLSLFVMPWGRALHLERITVSPEPVRIVVHDIGGELVQNSLVHEKNVLVYHNEMAIQPREFGFWVREDHAPVPLGETIVVPDLEPGEYALCRGSVCDTGYLAPQGRLELTLPQ